MLHDLSYRGGYPYRLTISDQPHVENVFPRAIQRGQTGAAHRSRPQSGRRAGRHCSHRRAAARIGERHRRRPTCRPGSYRFLEHPTDHSVLPTAATFRLDGQQVPPVVPGRRIAHAGHAAGRR